MALPKIENVTRGTDWLLVKLRTGTGGYEPKIVVQVGLQDNLLFQPTKYSQIFIKTK